MKKLRILVTGVGGDIAQSILKCIHDSTYEYFIVGCDIDKYSAGRLVVDEFKISPKVLDEDNYKKFISDTINQFSIEYIIPTSEFEIKYFNKYRLEFQAKNIYVLINNTFILDTFLDKYKTAKYLEEHNLPFPASYLLEEFQNQLKLPVLIKPRVGCGSKGIFKVRTLSELELYKKTLQDAIVQEYLDNELEEYTTGVFSSNNDVYSITFKRTLGFGGLSKIVEISDDDKINILAKTIAQKCKLKGAINLQSRKRGDNYVIFEINPRFSSTVYFRHYFGFTDVIWWLEAIMNKKINYQPKYIRGVGVRTSNEVFFNLE